MGDAVTSAALSAACLPLPLGCCCTALSVSDGINARNRTPEEKQKVYFELQKVDSCNKCGSSAQKVEVITHNV